MNVEKIEALKASYWDDVCVEIDEWIMKTLNQLRYTSPDKLQILQERVRTLEELKGWPDRVLEQRSPPKE